jgi:hypothetical protein
MRNLTDRCVIGPGRGDSLRVRQGRRQCAPPPHHVALSGESPDGFGAGRPVTASVPKVTGGTSPPVNL